MRLWRGNKKIKGYANYWTSTQLFIFHFSNLNFPISRNWQLSSSLSLSPSLPRSLAHPPEQIMGRVRFQTLRPVWTSWDSSCFEQQRHLLVIFSKLLLNGILLGLMFSIQIKLMLEELWSSGQSNYLQNKSTWVESQLLPIIFSHFDTMSCQCSQGFNLLWENKNTLSTFALQFQPLLPPYPLTFELIGKRPILGGTHWISATINGFYFSRTLH